jgi:hypothetical protein
MEKAQTRDKKPERRAGLPSPEIFELFQTGSLSIASSLRSAALAVQLSFAKLILWTPP